MTRLAAGWRRLPRDVRGAAWLVPTVAAIYAVIWPLLQFPGWH